LAQDTERSQAKQENISEIRETPNDEQNKPSQTRMVVKKGTMCEVLNDIMTSEWYFFVV